MKKTMMALMGVVLLLGASSCTTVKKTSTAQDVCTAVVAGSEADLEVSSKKISFYYKVPKSVRRGGTKSVKATAVAEALKANGNADVLVAPQYDMKIKRGSIREITVTGYPATYKNFRAAQLPACPPHHEKK